LVKATGEEKRARTRPKPSLEAPVGLNPKGRPLSTGLRNSDG